ncbi:hypothetical protein V1506DRAFT_291281 [Lipomyces tetrasporus]
MKQTVFGAYLYMTCLLILAILASRVMSSTISDTVDLRPSSRHVSATALVWFPTAKWLGPLRWWVPWKVQAIFAAAGRLLGLTPMMKKYISEEEFAEIQKRRVYERSFYNQESVLMLSRSLISWSDVSVQELSTALYRVR